MPILLKKGTNKVELVVTLQEFLNKKFGAKIKVDGDYGKNTEEAVKNFQKKFKLSEKNGIVGPETAAKLVELGIPGKNRFGPSVFGEFVAPKDDGLVPLPPLATISKEVRTKNLEAAAEEVAYQLTKIKVFGKFDEKEMAECLVDWAKDAGKIDDSKTADEIEVEILRKISALKLPQWVRANFVAELLKTLGKKDDILEGVTPNMLTDWIDKNPLLKGQLDIMLGKAILRALPKSTSAAPIGDLLVKLALNNFNFQDNLKTEKTVNMQKK